MDRWIRKYLVIVGLMIHVTPLWAAEVFRVGFPSLATGFAPSWVTADKGIWKKHGLDASKDVTFLSVGDGGPASRVVALSSGVIHATMFTPPSDLISEKAGMRILAKIDVANVGGGLNTTPAFIQKSRAQALRFLR